MGFEDFEDGEDEHTDPKIRVASEPPAEAAEAAADLDDGNAGADAADDRSLPPIERMGLVRRIEVRINTEKRPIQIDLHPNPLAPTEHQFKKPKRVRKMTVKVITRGGKPGLPVGFAEIVLEGKRK